MKKVKIKGREQFYLLISEQVPATLNDGHKEWTVEQPAPFMIDYMQHHNDLRVVIARTLADWDLALIYYVWWYQGRDLDRLDEMAMTDQDIAGYFSKTAILKYDIRVCRWGCQKRWHALIIDSGSIFWAYPPEFYLKQLRKDISEQFCPHCGAPLGLSTIRILGEELR